MARIAINEFKKDKKYVVNNVCKIAVRTTDIAKLYTVNGYTVIRLYVNKKEKRGR